MQTSEVWRAVPSAPGFEVSSEGRVRKRGKILRGHLDVDGYRIVGGDSLKVHRLVCEAWHGQPSPGVFACHHNGNRDDNRPTNLRWATAKENTRDRIEHGTYFSGSRSYQWRDDVDTGAVLLAISSGQSQRAVARAFGIGKTTVARIAAGLRSRSVYDGTRRPHSQAALDALTGA